MLQEVVAVRDSAHGKFWVKFGCGHECLFDSTKHDRASVYPLLNLDCPYCLTFTFDVGDEIELWLDYAHVPVLAKFMGYVDSRLRFIFPCGKDDWLIPSEIVSYKKVY